MDHNDIEIKDLPESQLEIAECIGLDAFRKLSSLCGGNWIYIDKPDTILRKKRNKRMRSEFNGCNVRELAVRYNLSETTVRSIVAPERERVKNDPTEGQLSL